MNIVWNGTRATLFGKFYEEIIRNWFDVQGYTVLPGKPRIYWSKQILPTGAVSPNHKRLVERLAQLREDQERSHCTPDGLIRTKDGRHLIWEAKNWIPQLFYAPFKNTVWTFPWLLAQTANYKGEDLPIDGLLISWWDSESDICQTLTELKKCVSPLTVDIFYTKNVLADCIDRQYAWYVNIVEKKREDVSKFFDSLLGR